METYNFKQLLYNITCESENWNNIIYSDDEEVLYKRLLQNWKKTSSEWALFESEDNEKGICECGRTINNLYTIRNKRNGKKLIVGSHCIKHFQNRQLNQDVKNKKRALISYNKLLDCRKLRLKIKFIKKCCDEHKFVYKISENHNELIKLIKKFNVIDNIIETKNNFYFRSWQLQADRKTITCIRANGAVRVLF